MGLIDFLIDTAALFQFFVGTFLHDPATVQNNDLVCGGKGGDPVGNQDDTGLAELLGNGLTDLGIGLGVHSGKGIVEDHDGAPADQHLRDCSPLLLSARELYAALTHVGIISFGEGKDKFVCACQLCGRDDLLIGGVGLSVGDIVTHASRKEVDVLRHNADLTAQGLHRDVADIRAVDADRALRHLVKARDQRAEGGFSAARGADEGNALQASLVGKNAGKVNLTVKKDGGDIDALTAATISSRAYAEAVAIAYEAFKVACGWQTEAGDVATGASKQKQEGGQNE